MFFTSITIHTLLLWQTNRKSAIMEKVISLTHEGLSRLGFNKDFELKTDDPEDTIKCSKSQISFISPVISKLLHSDPTINEFTLNTPGSSKCSEKIRSLLNGSTIAISKEMMKIFYSISFEFGNENIISCVEEDLTCENIFEILQIKLKFSLNIEREIDFIASNFCYFESSKISSLPVSIISSILSSDSLVVKSEHDLFEFICGLISQHEENQFLLAYLHIEFLDAADVSIFIEYINENNIGTLLPCIFRRLLCPITNSNSIHSRFNPSYINFKGKKFEGIFAQITKVIGGNPVIKEFINIEETTNYSQSNAYGLVDSLDKKKKGWFCGTNNIKGGAFVIDFKERRVSLNGYSFRSHYLATWGNENFMKSWKIEGSNDKEAWALIDKQKNSEKLSSILNEIHWSCQPSKHYRYFRIMMTDVNTSNNYHMALHSIEFFGHIKWTPTLKDFSLSDSNTFLVSRIRD